MQTFKEILKVPSAALQAMVDGLREQDKNPRFSIAMDTFGSSDGITCFGCAATCAIIKITNKQADPFWIKNTHLRAIYFNFDEYDLDFFEGAIDSARAGYFKTLFSYFNVIGPSLELPLAITNSNWRDQLSELEKIIFYLKLEGL